MCLRERAAILSWSLTCSIYLHPQSGNNIIFLEDLIVLRTHSHLPRSSQLGKDRCHHLQPTKGMEAALKNSVLGPHSLSDFIFNNFFSLSSNHSDTGLPAVQGTCQARSHPFTFAVSSSWGPQESVWLMPSFPPGLYSEITFWGRVP